jgi:RNA polymerase sigma-70 factor (ECF subfamily)
MPASAEHEGDAVEALKQQIVELLPRLRAFALALARSAEAADDLVQGTCERALRGLAGYRPDSRLDSWLFRILHNLWIDGHRRRRPQVDLDEPGLEALLGGEDGRTTTEARSSLAATARAIESLPEEQRAVLALVCVEDLSYRETAEVLGIPIGTVMSRLSRARRSLAAALRHEEDRPGAAGATGR